MTDPDTRVLLRDILFRKPTQPPRIACNGCGAEENVQRSGLCTTCQNQLCVRCMRWFDLCVCEEEEMRNWAP